MAPPGTIIGQIQAAAQPTAIPQVAPSPQQMQQIQQGSQQIALAVSAAATTTPQHIPLPPNVVSVKDEQSAPADSSAQSSANADSKENGIDGKL